METWKPYNPKGDTPEATARYEFDQTLQALQREGGQCGPMCRCLRGVLDDLSEEQKKAILVAAESQGESLSERQSERWYPQTGDVDNKVFHRQITMLQGFEVPKERLSWYEPLLAVWNGKEEPPAQSLARAIVEAIRIQKMR